MTHHSEVKTERLKGHLRSSPFFVSPPTPLLPERSMIIKRGYIHRAFFFSIWSFIRKKDLPVYLETEEEYEKQNDTAHTQGMRLGAIESIR